MKNEEAKFVLHAYRPNGADAGDATFAEALEQTRRDPALEKWFAAQQAFDRAMCAKLGAVQPPSALRAAILTGARVSGGASAAPRPWWRSNAWLGLAAAAAVAIAATLALWPQRAEAQPVLIDFALNDTLRQAHRGQHGDAAAELQALLSTENQRLGGGMKLDFDLLKDSGCRTISFDGRPVLEVCFKRDGRWYHCYMARVSDFPEVAKRLRPTFRDQQGASAAAWADGEYIYVVASKAGREAIQKLI